MIVEKSEKRFIHPRVLSLITTYKCTAACEHCCFDCTPNSKGRLTLDDMTEAILSAHSLGSLQSIVFTGGECFLLGNDLAEAIELASGLGLITRCVTNGYWAKSITRGRLFLNKFVEAGLNELNISTGDYHQQYVPLTVVENATVLSMEAGLNTRIMVEETTTRSCTADQVRQLPRIRPLLESQPQLEKNKTLDVLESPWMPMDYSKVILQHDDRMLNSKKLTRCQGCTSIFTTIVRSPDENDLGICCGLSRKKIPELNKKFETGSLENILTKQGEDFMKIWIHVDGPERILAWAASKCPLIEWENRYSHHCHACLALFHDPLVRETILEHYQERVEDVLVRYSFSLQQQDLLESETFG